MQEIKIKLITEILAFMCFMFQEKYKPFFHTVVPLLDIKIMMTKQLINLNLSDLGQNFKYSKSLVMESKSPFLKKSKMKIR